MFCAGDGADASQILNAPHSSRGGVGPFGALVLCWWGSVASRVSTRIMEDCDFSLEPIPIANAEPVQSLIRVNRITVRRVLEV
jgi:hypothetical protein